MVQALTSYYMADELDTAEDDTLGSHSTTTGRVPMLLSSSLHVACEIVMPHMTSFCNHQKRATSTANDLIVTWRQNETSWMEAPVVSRVARRVARWSRSRTRMRNTRLCSSSIRTRVSGACVPPTSNTSSFVQRLAILRKTTGGMALQPVKSS